MSCMPSVRDLPDDVESLQRLVIAARSEIEAMRAALLAEQLAVEKLRIELARLKRMQFGRSSERLEAQIAQLELSIEEIESSAAQRTETAAAAETSVPAASEPGAPYKADSGHGHRRDDRSRFTRRVP